MQNEIKYEWTLEEFEDGDIVDSNFSDTLWGLDLDNLTNKELGLVRNEGNENNGLVDRHWAYVKDGKLPEFFSTSLGYQTSLKVPKRFHEELAKRDIF